MPGLKKDIESLRKDIERLHRYKLGNEDYRQKLYDFKKSLNYWEKRFDENDMDSVRSFYHDMQEIVTYLPNIEKNVYNKKGRIVSKQAQHKANHIWNMVYELYHLSYQIQGDEASKREKNRRLMLIVIALILVFSFPDLKYSFNWWIFTSGRY